MNDIIDRTNAKMNKGETVFEIKNLTVEFNTSDGMFKAVDNLSFVIPRGKTVGLVGESGSGKSVTSLALMRLLTRNGHITSGEIHYQGKDLVKISEEEMRSLRGSKISMIFQEPMTSLNPVLTVGDQLIESIQLHLKLNKKDAFEKALALFKQVKIPQPEVKIHSFPHELSGGQKQRVMIAMAIACDPELLICDEPTTALDVTIQQEILDLIKSLQVSLGMSVLFITHDLGVISNVADHLLVMYRSKLVEEGNAQEVFKNPKHPYTRGLLSCRPKLDANPNRLLTVSDYMSEDGTALKVDPARLVEVDRQGSRVEKIKESEDILVIRNLKTYFPIRTGFFKTVRNHFKAVDDVSFTIKKGTSFGLVGESGCGKTTLGRTILKLVEPSGGDIIFKGQHITGLTKAEMRPFRKKMQIIFQDPYSSLDPRMSVEKILSEPLEINSPEMSRSEKNHIISTLIEKVGLRKNHLKRYPHEFSGGQRQRICIARALTLNPELLICDESVSALDVSVQAQVLNLLLDLQEEFKLTYVFISHDLSVVNFMADTVAVMNEGKIVELESAKNIYQNPKHHYTQKLINAVPKITNYPVFALN